jgi:hypothetical protein
VIKLKKTADKLLLGKDELVTPKRTEKVSFMDVKEQLEYFSDCVYVLFSDKIFVGRAYDPREAEKAFLDAKRFNSFFGGYNFIIDRKDGGDTPVLTTVAWEVFTRSRLIVFPKVRRFNLMRPCDNRSPYFEISTQEKTIQIERPFYQDMPMVQPLGAM